MAKHISTRDVVVASTGVDWKTGKSLLAVHYADMPGDFSPWEAWADVGQSNRTNNAFINNGQDTLDFIGKDSLDSRLFEISQGRQISDMVAPAAGQIKMLTNQAQDGRTDTRVVTNSKLHYGKHRLEWFPSIQRIVVSSRSVDNTSLLASGTGSTSGQWQANGPTGNGTLLAAAIAEMSTFLSANPKYRFTHCVSDLGSSDALGSVAAADFKVAYKAMVAEYRGAMRGGDEALWIIQPIPVPIRSQGTGAAIHQALLDMGTPGHIDYIPRAHLVYVDDIPRIDNDVYHYTYTGVRTLGERIHRLVAEHANFSKISVLPEYHFQYHPGEGKFVNTRRGFEGVGNIWSQRFVFDPSLVFNELVLETAAAAGSFLGFDTDWRFDPTKSYTKSINVIRRNHLNLAHHDPFICGGRQHFEPGDPRIQPTPQDGHFFGRNLITNLTDGNLADFWEFTEVPGVTDAAANAPNYYGYWPFVGEGTVNGSNQWVPPSESKSDCRAKDTWIVFGMTFNAETQETKLYYNGQPVRASAGVTKVITELQPNADPFPPGAEQIVQIMAFGHTLVAGKRIPFAPGNFDGYCRRAVLLNGRAATDTEMLALALA